MASTNWIWSGAEGSLERRVCIEEYGIMLARVIVYMFMVLLGVSLLLESPVPVAIAP